MARLVPATHFSRGVSSAVSRVSVGDFRKNMLPGPDQDSVAVDPDGDVLRTQAKMVPRRSMRTLEASLQMLAPSPFFLQCVSDQVWTMSPKRFDAAAVTVYCVPEARSVVPSGLVTVTAPGLESPGGENDHVIVVA